MHHFIGYLQPANGFQYFIDIHVNILLTYKIVIPILTPVRGDVL